MNFLNKYQKYKNKYNNLKKLIGGNNIKIIEDKYKDVIFEIKCFSHGFKQHTGECWNDAIMMFFCSQDEIKDVVQRKLKFLTPDDIIKLCLLRDRQKLLPPKYLEKENFDDMILNLKEYLNLMKQRFNYYYNYYNEVEVNQKMPIDFKGDSSPRLGIECAQYGNNLNLAEQPMRGDGGGTSNGILSVLIILSCFLLDDIELIFNIKNINKIKREDINITAVYNCYKTHATIFYICNKIKYHYDDNKPIPIKIDFKSYLDSRVKSIEEKKYDDNIFTINYDTGQNYKLESVYLIKINEDNSEDIKNKINSFFYLEYWYDYDFIDDPKINFNNNSAFKLLVDKYLKLGFNINNYFDEDGNSLLHYCIEYEINYIDDIFIKNIDIPRIKFLIEKGIDINLQDKNDNTILQIILNDLKKKIEEKKDISIITDLKLELEDIIKGKDKSLICCDIKYDSSSKYCEKCAKKL
jgi:hypothetical protein